MIIFLSFLFQVSIFLKDKVQNSNGRFVLPTTGSLPHGTENPGLIRFVQLCRFPKSYQILKYNTNERKSYQNNFFFFAKIQQIKSYIRIVI